MLGEGGCWEGWEWCLRGQKVLSEVAAATDLLIEVVAAVVQIDADVVAPRC